jgi:hypothetical protein
VKVYLSKARRSHDDYEIFNPFVISRCKGSGLLNEKFGELNRVYFGGGLPRFKVLLCSKPKNFGHNVAGYCLSRKREILIRNGLGERATLQTLVHEMVHAKLSESNTSQENELHGRSFVEELRRLRALGAPLSPLDLDKQKRAQRNVSVISEKCVRDLVEMAKSAEKLDRTDVSKFLERELEIPFSAIVRQTNASRIIKEVYG